MPDPKDLLNHDYAPGGLLRSARSNPAPMMGIRTLSRYKRPPLLLIAVVAALIIASFIPIVAAFSARFQKSDQPRVHLFQDMDNQAKYKAQAPSPVFEDGRAMRQPVAGTVARGQLIDDPAYHLGYYAQGAGGEVSWVDGMPERLEVDRKFMERGQELYNRFCFLCHGYDGYGNGPIHVRASKLGAAAGQWVQPSNLHDETRLGRSDGHLYNTVNVGIRNMAGYGTQIRDPSDRWAIVAYVRALQLSQQAPLDAAPEGVELRVVPALVNGEPLPVAEPEADDAGADEPAEAAVDEVTDADGDVVSIR